MQDKEENKIIEEVKQLAEDVHKIELESRYSFKFNLNVFFRELKKEIINKKEYINFVAVLFGVTGIFLNINKEVDYIKNVQVLLLILSLISFVILSYKIYINATRKLLGDIGGSLKIFYAVINAFLLYNISRFIWLNYTEELWILLKYLSFPLVLLFFNLFVVLIYKWNKHKNVIKNLWFVEYLLINIIALNFWGKLNANNLDLFKTFHSYTDIENNIHIYSLILLYILDAFDVFSKIDFLRKLRTTKFRQVVIDLLIYAIPTGLFYLIKYFFY